jgi:acetolactate synthase-1/2/3 large subunit
MSQTMPAAADQTVDEPVGDAVARYLADIGVSHVFGVISIHNMPILDAIWRQGRITFVPARSESGAMNMADAFARVSRSLGVVITSTGTAAGNAAGSQVEALTAGSPVLHITSQLDTVFMDRDRAAIHDVPKQPDMLKAVSKAYFRIWEGRGCLATLQAAASAALSAPTGPVSLEIPIDVQRHRVAVARHTPKPALAVVTPDAGQLDAIATLVRAAKRPLLLLGGGARAASSAATALVERGFCAVTSTNGRATVPEDHPRSLGAYNMTPEAQRIYETADLMIIVGSRLRGNETRNNEMHLPKPVIQIDADASQGGRNFAVDMFVHGDARLALEGLLARLPNKLEADESFAKEVASARRIGEANLERGLGPYEVLARHLSQRVKGGAHPWVRDVTIGNSTFGNRYVKLAAPHLGVHALGGGIGQGIAMAIGDGGAQLNIGEFATAVENGCDIVYVMMNDKAYGVIANIQDAQYEGRHAYCKLLTPDFGLMAQSIGLAHERVTKIEAFAEAFDRALASKGPILLEVDMTVIGPYASAFGGPPAGAAGGAR